MDVLRTSSARNFAEWDGSFTKISTNFAKVISSHYIYITFIRSCLDYANIIYDQAYNSAFHDKLESVQYDACLAITGAIRGTSTEKIYQELGLESLKSRRWFRKLCHFYEIFNEKSPSYLFNLISNFNRVHNTRLSYNIPPIKVRHDYFKNSFFPSAITE